MSVTGKISAGKTALILIILLGIWLAFTAVPPRKAEVVKTPVAESDLARKLRSVGLPNNPDLGGLPEIFAIWSGSAEWKDDKTRFAYWHPVMKTYSYYFEAVRKDGRIRFKEISEPRDVNFHWDESLPDDCPIRFYISGDGAAPTDKSGRHAIVTPPEFDNKKVRIEITTPETPSPSLDSGPIKSQPES